MKRAEFKSWFCFAWLLLQCHNLEEDGLHTRRIFDLHACTKFPVTQQRVFMWSFFAHSYKSEATCWDGWRPIPQWVSWRSNIPIKEKWTSDILHPLSLHQLQSNVFLRFPSLPSRFLRFTLKSYLTSQFTSVRSSKQRQEVSNNAKYRRLAKKTELLIKKML